MEKFTRFVEKIGEKSDETAEVKLEKEWAENNDSHYEFYHKMRGEGFDGEILMNFLSTKIFNK
jgi:uncharacterized protein (UPF0335 family)